MSPRRSYCARLEPALYHQLRYEDLLADPAAVLREAVSFLGIPYAEQMIRFFEGKTKLKRRLVRQVRLASAHPWFTLLENSNVR